MRRLESEFLSFLSAGGGDEAPCATLIYVPCSYPGITFSARPVVGGLFSLLAL